MMNLILKLITTMSVLMLMSTLVGAGMEMVHASGLVTFSDSTRLIPWYALGGLMVLNCVLMTASLCKLAWDMWTGRDT